MPDIHHLGHHQAAQVRAAPSGLDSQSRSGSRARLRLWRRRCGNAAYRADVRHLRHEPRTESTRRRAAAGDDPHVRSTGCGAGDQTLFGHALSCHRRYCGATARVVIGADTLSERTHGDGCALGAVAARRGARPQAGGALWLQRNAGGAVASADAFIAGTTRNRRRQVNYGGDAGARAPHRNRENSGPRRARRNRIQRPKLHDGLLRQRGGNRGSIHRRRLFQERRSRLHRGRRGLRLFIAHR